MAIGNRLHSLSSEEEEGDPPPLKKKSIEEGPYALPVDLGSDEGGENFVEERDPMQSKDDALENRPLDDLQFIDGTPAQFLNQQLVSEVGNLIPNAAPPGLVKLDSESMFPTFVGNGHHKLGKSLSRKLKRQITGSYTKYDGERNSSISCTRESDGSVQREKMRLTKSVTPAGEVDIAIGRHNFAAGIETLVHRTTAANETVSSSIRIDSAIQRGSERLKWSQRSSTSTSHRESSAENEDRVPFSNSEQASLCGNAMADKRRIGEMEMRVADECLPPVVLKSEEEMSMSTATFCGTSRREAVTDENTYNGSVATTMHNVDTPLANSLNELLEKGVPSGLQEKNSPLYASCEQLMEVDATSSSSLSICSELNARIIQRGGRTRLSGRSNKDKMLRKPSPPSLPPPLPPRKQSSQPYFSKNFTPMPDGDYVDIDAIMDKNQNEYVNRSVLIYSSSDRVPKVQSYNTTDYVQICPNATLEFRKIKPSTTQTPMRRSSSLYNFMFQQIPGLSPAKTNNEAEYYARNWELYPRSFVSSSSHVLFGQKGTLKKKSMTSEAELR